MGGARKNRDAEARVGTQPPEAVGDVFAPQPTTPEAGGEAPPILYEAWDNYPDERRIRSVEEASANVSTNQVFRLRLSDGGSIIAKVSSYASYFLFREDHDRIHLWNQLLQRTRYKNFLADSLTVDDRVYTHYDGSAWAVFYNDVQFQESLPRILGEEQVINLAEEIAYFHKECRMIVRDMPLTSKSIKSDIINLLDNLTDKHSARSFHLPEQELDFLRRSCYAFLVNLDDLRYDYWQKLPLLIDWNIGNFSVQYRGNRFRLYSRWDYDWFRMEPPMLDFYFMSRVVSQTGDRTVFSYMPDCLLEPRFQLFLRVYHSINPLTEEDLLFLKEAYRFFILNYVIKEGQHFFRQKIIKRLKQEALSMYLMRLEELDFRQLFAVLEES